MFRKLLYAFTLLLTTISIAQIKGKVTDEKGNPLPFVNIFEENTYNGTTTNEQGKFELNIRISGNHTIIFQYLGYKTAKQVVTIDKTPVDIEVVLAEENIILNEVVINPKDNPANEIIRKAIQNKKENSAKTAKYKADFYSRGIFRIKDAPKTILGQKFDFFDEVLDSTRSGILYLSETVSRITFQKPDKMKEVIVASKVSGNDNGFSFNNAASVNFDFYENYLPFEINVVSPIADNAFNYYKYQFEGSFFTENRQQINKIKVIPRRNTEPVMDGYIYIVDDSYAVYAVDLSIKGNQMQTPALDQLNLKQSFSYNTNSKIWVKNTQTIDFVAGMLSIKLNGRFTYVYSNFEFEPEITKRTFTSQVLAFEENANKKEDAFWNTIRPVPLTEEETTDYLKKDVLQTKKKSQTYLDSIDNKRNKFRPMDILNGYSYRNSFKKWSIDYDGPLLSTSFNTVQGWRINAGLSYTKRNEEKRTFTRIGSRFDYGFSEEKIRATASFAHKFNNLNNSFLSVNAGSAVSQFNPGNPISNIVNTVSTLFFKNNFMKLYEKNFASAFFGREVVNGFYMNANIEYSERKPLYNTTDYTIIKNTDAYTSNNPLSPFDETSAAIEKHNLVKANVLMRFNFGQKYWSRPDGKFNIPNDDYPTLSLGYEKGLAASDKNYEYDLLMGRVTYEVTLGNKGFMQMNLKAGKFFNADNISFVDYKHFNGNQTHIGQTDSYTNVFNLLPYYAASTNDSYFETHIEHNDKGYFMNKLPLLKHLQSQLVLGFHNLSVPDRKPYQEFSIGLDNLGFGKFKFLRVDYVRSYQNGYQGDGVVFGLKFLNVLE
ncbi:carboxypeptidase-like regulatory domain-containing protein [Flavobacterium sp. J49]|uniref:DUF5686 and carboxypeptidase regulatory-like domain-containing protein n=1 Tax=Flavobacterium sp. J49 TaxID=2718534 RepID=UPI0015933F81|nr:DUF5686 and carboxypeptidase regulatory-like domain-containing protein [Flavobacterium sp. J49]MBF6641075.1 carboxypeptidase-like regulatory domain-containing protein [Flavobacterium sp. J49]NIC02322.1 carboxypeptidase-like regulatory domain-containing protein [Flavobacterium sp. J49]